MHTCVLYSFDKVTSQLMLRLLSLSKWLSLSFEPESLPLCIFTCLFVCVLVGAVPDAVTI